MNNKTYIQNIIHMLKDQNNHLAHIKQYIKNCINNGFDINTKYLKGNTLAHYVIKYNVTGLFLFLKKNGLNLDICNDNYDAPIHFAVRNKKYKLVKELIQAGADINMLAELDQSALHIAVSEMDKTMVKLLLSLGIDKSLVDERNASALDYALDEHNNEIIELLKGGK